tara:strand:+ start:1246 stop:1560 length:315 start_codon:yes stop_codon:yes gene_type:complete
VLNQLKEKTMNLNFAMKELEYISQAMSLDVTEGNFDNLASMDKRRKELIEMVGQKGMPLTLANNNRLMLIAENNNSIIEKVKNAQQGLQKNYVKSRKGFKVYSK